MGAGAVSITALTVSREPITMDIPGVQHRNLHGRLFKRAADVQAAWFDAVDLVDTDRFFFIDDDDTLTADYERVLQRCVETGAAVAYTDEIVGSERRHRGPYSQDAHLKNPTLVHHLAVCETALAREVIRDLPRGHYWPEMMLFWEMAKRGGAVHVPEIGYCWNRRRQGLHSQWFTVLGMTNSRTWCMENP